MLLDLYEGLTSESPSGEVIPGVAESWTLDSTGTQYTFHLRTDARWSNGHQVRAQDFVASWQRTVDPKFGSPTADDLRLISRAGDILSGKAAPSALGVTAYSDSTLVVKLERPAAYFPQILAHPSAFPIYSEATARTHSPKDWISNGPYTLAAWQPATGIDLTANPQYWDHNNVHIKSVSYKFIPNDSSQYAGYRAGEIDVTDIVPANALPTLRQGYPSQLIIAPFLATAYYGINLTQEKLSNVALRQALAMAIDRKRLVESLGFGQSGAYGFVPPGTADYTPQSWDWKTLADAERIAEARRLYAQAGFSTTKPLRLRVLFNTNEVIQRTAVVIAAMWREVLGIEVELTAEEFKVFLQSRHDTSRWDVARLAWTADFNDASNFLDVMRVHSPNNDMGYVNPQFDSALDKAADMTDVSRRRAALQSAEKVMLDDYPIIPLYYFVSKRLVKPYVLGVVPNPMNHLPSKALSFSQ
ncbi:MAG TPA: peptide ABC transporter substrate-binding protein [Steroidobacteraceae bacterium]|nr:peptide ABC transporter substrate-binding protein [Steroidobacteraceae bacterium]